MDVKPAGEQNKHDRIRKQTLVRDSAIILEEVGAQEQSSLCRLH